MSVACHFLGHEDTVAAGGWLLACRHCGSVAPACMQPPDPLAQFAARLEEFAVRMRIALIPVSKALGDLATVLYAMHVAGERRGLD